jgi:hypothetical protein
MLGVVRPGLYSAQGRVLACEPRETATASGDLLPYARNGFPSWCKAQKEGGARGSFGGRSQEGPRVHAGPGQVRLGVRGEAPSSSRTRAGGRRRR